MTEDPRFVKRPCTRCGEPTYLICYIRRKLVCVECFAAVCDQFAQLQPKNQLERLPHA